MTGAEGGDEHQDDQIHEAGQVERQEDHLMDREKPGSNKLGKVGQFGALVAALVIELIVRRRHGI